MGNKYDVSLVPLLELEWIGKDNFLSRNLKCIMSKPVNVLMGLKGATYSVEELAAVGVKRISVGGAFARAALGAFVRAAKEVKNKGTFAFAEDAISYADVSSYMANVKRQ